MIENHNIFLDNGWMIFYTFIGMVIGAFCAIITAILLHTNGESSNTSEKTIALLVAASLVFLLSSTSDKIIETYPKISNSDPVFLKSNILPNEPKGTISGIVTLRGKEFKVDTTDTNIIKAYTENPKSVFLYAKFTTSYASRLFLKTDRPDGIQYHFFVDKPE